MKKYIIITADTNDADYITSKNVITDEELQLITPVIQAIKYYTESKSTKQKWNWDTHGYNDLTPESRYLESEIVSEEAFYTFEEFCPTGGEHGFHSIVHIEVLEVANEICLFKGPNFY